MLSIEELDMPVQRSDLRLTQHLSDELQPRLQAKAFSLNIIVAPH